ncbi:outer mitochondrial transmembrane helix translocase-like [Simochromis diagramma]|uniref:outer mitochondrial transmembrane helix translocase-like n=1 Tax=Simochromis diagramma TaxID=43689 RepID=UPI001A7E4676|nr:outer mitochondrial transmembrane helix translocase-like [Simochromis diagramma]
MYALYVNPNINNQMIDILFLVLRCLPLEVSASVCKADESVLCQVIIMGATNRPEDIDPAILRRMPTKIHIKLPNFEQRKQILRLILENEKVDPLINFSHIAGETEGFSGSDLKEICREAALLCFQEIMDSDTLSIDHIRPISQDDLQNATRKMKKSKIPGGHSTIFSDDPIRQINQDDLQSNTAGRYGMLMLYIIIFQIIVIIYLIFRHTEKNNLLN